MLLRRSKDLAVSHSDVVGDGDTGSAHWEAHYTFTGTGRKVHNIIDAKFRFRDARIIEHVDTFDFWRWSRQALGLSGVLLGWSPLMQNKARKTAAAGLAAFRSKNPSRGPSS
jgi:hypothetical protein